MATSHTGNINSIKIHQWLQRVYISVNPYSKRMKNACILKYDYEKSFEQGDFVLPVLEARGCDFDWNPSLDMQAS